MPSVVLRPAFLHHGTLLDPILGALGWGYRRLRHPSIISKGHAYSLIPERVSFANTVEEAKRKAEENMLEGQETLHFPGYRGFSIVQPSAVVNYSVKGNEIQIHSLHLSHPNLILDEDDTTQNFQCHWSETQDFQPKKSFLSTLMHLHRETLLKSTLHQRGALEGIFHTPTMTPNYNRKLSVVEATNAPSVPESNRLANWFSLRRK